MVEELVDSGNGIKRSDSNSSANVNGRVIFRCSCRSSSSTCRIVVMVVLILVILMVVVVELVVVVIVKW